MNPTNFKTLNTARAKKFMAEQRKLGSVPPIDATADWMEAFTMEQEKWIPVSERLPKDHTKYWITTDCGVATTARFYPIGTAEVVEPHFRDTNGHIVKAIAWMQYFAPEPYQLRSEGGGE